MLEAGAGQGPGLRLAEAQLDSARSGLAETQAQLDFSSRNLARTRSLAVNVRTQENNTFKPLPVEETFDTDESSYPFNFDLTITQRFEGTDPLAVNVSKAH